MKYYIFRISYEDKKFQTVRNEMLQGHLRQGWGTYGMDIRNSEKDFLDARVKEWGKFEKTPRNKTREYHVEKYYNLRTMLNIEIGDLIVVPKVSEKFDYVGRYFSVLKCTKKYDFDVLKNFDDFGHIIGVEFLFSCPYDFDGETQIISGKFRSYQRSVNNVWKDDFKNAVDKLIEKYKNNPQTFSANFTANNFEILAQSTKDARKIYLEKILEYLRKISPKILENIIEELFVKNGHKLIRRNFYNGVGGDVDLVFEIFPENTLMRDIFRVNEYEPKIFIQVKKKIGKDFDDTAGINQLTQMDAENGGNNTLILINLADEFTDEAKQLAAEKNIILLDGIIFADIAVRHGVPVGI